MFEGCRWLNEPREWRLDSDGLAVTTDARTDFWRETHYGFTRHSGHFFGRETAGDFTASLRVRARYERLYDQAGIQLSRYRLVGLGSICRRQATGEIGMIVRSLGAVLPLHGFGCKTAGLARYGRWLASADSMAWSVAGRREPGQPRPQIGDGVRRPELQHHVAARTG